MQTGTVLMNIAGDSGTNGSNIKQSSVTSGSDFKTFLLSANNKYVRKINFNHSLKTINNTGRLEEKQEPLNSEQLPELQISQFLENLKSGSNGNSLSTQKDKTVKEESADEGNNSSVSSMQPNFIFDPNLLYLLKMNGISGDNISITGNITDQIVSTSNVMSDAGSNGGTVLNGVVEKIINLLKEQISSNQQFKNGGELFTDNLINQIADLIKNSTSNSQQVISQDPTFFDDLMNKISEILKDAKETISIDLIPDDLQNFILLMKNGIDHNSSKIVSDDTLKFVEENISKLRSALEDRGIKIDDLNIKGVKFSGQNQLNTESLQISSGVGSLKNNSQSTSKEMNFSHQFESLFSESAKEQGSLDLIKGNFPTGFEGFINHNISESFKSDSNAVDKLIDPQRIIDTIVKDVSQTLQNGKTELEVKLMPESLGKLTVKVTMENGKMSANIEVKNIDVKQIIDANMVKMRNDLNQSGINLDKINVFLSDSNQFENSQNRYFQQKSKSKNTSGDLNIPEELDFARSLGYNTMEYIV